MESNTSRRELRFTDRVPIPLPLTLSQGASIASSPAPLEPRLQRLEQLASVGTLSAGLAHEIKNAMVAIRTFVEMLLAENKQAELADIVQREMLRIDSIVSQMLRLSGEPRSSLSTVGINELLNRSLRLIEPQLTARQIRLKKSLRARSDSIEADAHQLHQAFINLLLNAVDAIGQDGELEVMSSVLRSRRSRGTTNRASATLHVRIHDTGPGIRPEELSRIFEPFYTTKANGTGLGLAITRQIIEQHHGTISVESQPSKGTTFQITLPLRP